MKCIPLPNFPNEYQALYKETDTRSYELLREHYEIERELAEKLRNAPPQDRRRLYTQVYEELFCRVPHHPQLTRKNNEHALRCEALQQLEVIRPLLHPGCTVAEIGSGDCALAQTLAPFVRRVIALDVSPTIMHLPTPPPCNIVRIVFDGYSFPVPDNSIDLTLSNQLIEHLHPEDARAQLKELHRILTPGGKYLCITPHRLSGPHDISRYFDRCATGLHLKEYVISELVHLFRDVGFSSFRIILRVSRQRHILWPLLPVHVLEKFLLLLPRFMSVTLARRLPIGVFRVIRFVAVKHR
ncbi:MAG: class I SAM-dependent methyltransferase [Desulfobacterota bacterium]|nr:class I SAM-dependent methyltransferase [Thermodesulfobacteriota bacterium]